MISASHVGAFIRCDSCPSHDDVGGLFFEFEAIRTELRCPAQESRPEAIALDGRLARAWVGHNALHVVENGTGSFEEKMRRTGDVVCRSLGVPGPRSQPRWWIVRNVDEAALAQLEPAEWKLEHVFLRTSDGTESRVTKKSSVGGGPATYHHRVRGKMVGDEHSTSERTLSLREYKALLKTRDPGRLKIKKTRRAFLWRDEYYMLDTFHSPESASGADSASSLTLNLPGSLRWRLYGVGAARRHDDALRRGPEGRVLVPALP